MTISLTGPATAVLPFFFVVVSRMPRVLRYIDMVLTVCLTSTDNQVPGNQEFCLALCETIVGAGTKLKKSRKKKILRNYNIKVRTVNTI